MDARKQVNDLFLQGKITVNYKITEIATSSEQSSTEGHWNPPKNDSPHPQTEEKPHQDRERGGGGAQSR